MVFSHIDYSNLCYSLFYQSTEGNLSNQVVQKYQGRTHWREEESSDRGCCVVWEGEQLWGLWHLLKAQTLHPIFIRKQELWWQRGDERFRELVLTSTSFFKNLTLWFFWTWCTILISPLCRCRHTVSKWSVWVWFYSKRGKRDRRNASCWVKIAAKVLSR